MGTSKSSILVDLLPTKWSLPCLEDEHALVPDWSRNDQPPSINREQNALRMKMGIENGFSNIYLWTSYHKMVMVHRG